MRTQILEFFGVSTGASSSMRMFGTWTAALGVDNATIRGIDLPLGTDLSAHRAAVVRLKEDPDARGALVTSHKLAVVRAASDLIDHLTPEAQLCGEVSALYKRDGQLWGHACDPANCGTAMRHFLGTRWWQNYPEAQVLLLGGGGAAVAMLVHLLTQARSRPQSVTIVEKRPDNLAHCQKVARNLEAHGMGLKFVLNSDPKTSDTLVQALPPGSLVINATGMGKDLPGSPVTDSVRYPFKGAVWELNYRGERPFLHQARAQADARHLTVVDGWHYFLYGWSSVMGLVFDVPITPERFKAFSDVSEASRR